MPETQTASLSIKVSQEGVDQAASSLSRLTQAGAGADASFSKLAMQIAGFTSLTGLAVQAGQKVVSVVKDLAKESITLAAGFEKSKVTWGVLVGSMEDGAKVFEEIRSFAAKTPLSFEALNQAATTIKGFGVAAADIIPTLSKLGDVAMGDNNKLQSLALVYGQVMAQGKAKTQDLYQFINAGVPIFNLLADSMGVSAGKIKDLASEGAITFEEINKAITKATSAGGQFNGMMDKTSQTTEGKWSTAVDNFKASLADLGERVLPLVNSLLDTYNKHAERAAANQNAWDYMSKGEGSATDALKFLTDELTARQAELEKVQNLISSSHGFADVGGVLSLKVADLEKRIALTKAQISEVQQMALEQQRLKGSMSSGVVAPTTPTSSAPAWDEGWKDEFKNATGVGVVSTGTEAVNAYIQKLNQAEAVAESFGDSTVDALNKSKDELRSVIEQLLASGKFEEGDSTIIALRTAYYSKEADAILEVRDAEWKRKLSGGAVTETTKEETEATKNLEQSLKNINSAFASAGQDLWVNSFKSIGEALASGASGAETFGEAIADVGKTILDNMPALLFQAALQAMFNGNWTLGLALLAASGVTAIGSGVADYYSDNAMGGVYGGGLSQYANGVYGSPHYFNFARGSMFGWEGMQSFATGRFGEGSANGSSGTEAIMPLSRASDGSLGVRSTGGSKVSVSVVNNLGTQASASVEESTGSDGTKQLKITLEKAVAAMAASGKLDKSLGSRYGLAVQGRRVN